MGGEGECAHPPSANNIHTWSERSHLTREFDRSLFALTAERFSARLCLVGGGFSVGGTGGRLCSSRCVRFYCWPRAAFKRIITDVFPYV